MPNWLVTSLMVSVVLTVALNLIPRLFPNATRKAGAKLQQQMQQTDEGSHRYGDSDSEMGDRRPSGGVKVFFPWKAMLIGSVLLTVVLNLGRFFG